MAPCRIGVHTIPKTKGLAGFQLGASEPLHLLKKMDSTMRVDIRKKWDKCARNHM